MEETHPEYFTCRPVKPIESTFGEYHQRLQNSLNQTSYIFLLIDEKSKNPLGQYFCFDINNRNHSIEIGYYFPTRNRGKGYGKAGVILLLNGLFRRFNFNKVYATTSENNKPSVAMLEATGFSLDGRNREHYWIGENRFDQLAYSILRKEWHAQSGECLRRDGVGYVLQLSR